LQEDFFKTRLQSSIEGHSLKTNDFHKIDVPECNFNSEVQKVKLSEHSNNLLKLFLFVYFLLTLGFGWNCDFWADEQFTLIECMGNYPDQTPFNIAIKDSYLSTEFWSNRSLKNLYDINLNIDNGNMIFHHALVYGLISLKAQSYPYLLTLVSVISGAIIIIWVYRLSKILFSERVGLFAAFFALLNPELMLISTEVRSYSLALGLSLIVTEIYLKIVSEYEDIRLVSWRPLFYTAASILMFFSHTLTFMVLICHVIYSLLFLRDRRKWIILTTSGVVVISAVSCWYLFLGGKRAFESSSAIIKLLAWINEVYSNKSHARFNSYNVIAMTVHNISYLIGFDMTRLLPGLQVRMSLVPIFLYFSAFIISLILNLKYKFFTLRHVFVIVMLSSMSIITCLFMSIRSGLVHWLWEYYQRFSIVFCVILSGWIVETFCMRLKISKTTNLLNHLFVQFVLIFSIILGLIYAQGRYSSLKTNEYFIAAKYIQSLDHSKQVDISVDSVLDAQLLSLYLGSDKPYLIRIPDNTKLQKEYQEMGEKTGIDHPAVVFVFANLMRPKKPQILINQVPFHRKRHN
jgi:uncharacterized membrane protein